MHEDDKDGWCATSTDKARYAAGSRMRTKKKEWVTGWHSLGVLAFLYFVCVGLVKVSGLVGFVGGRSKL